MNDEFVHSVCEFVSATTDHLLKHGEATKTIAKRSDLHTKVILRLENSIEHLESVLEGYKQLLIEHETKIKDLEKILDNGDPYRPAKKKILAN